MSTDQLPKFKVVLTVPFKRTKTVRAKTAYAATLAALNGWGLRYTECRFSTKEVTDEA